MITAAHLLCCGCFIKVDRTCLFRGSKSRNKVSVGEPAEGSLLITFQKNKKKYIYIKNFLSKNYIESCVRNVIYNFIYFFINLKKKK
jgi:hypothetical protein